MIVERECAWCGRLGRTVVRERERGEAVVVCDPCSIVLEHGDDPRARAFVERLAHDPEPDDRGHVWLGERRLTQDEARAFLEQAARSEDVPTLTRAELRRRLDDGEVPGEVVEWLLADLGAE